VIIRNYLIAFHQLGISSQGVASLSLTRDNSVTSVVVLNAVIEAEDR